MDNLDRTNVVQATLAKYTLNVQLRDLGILSANDGIDDFESFSKEFRESAFPRSSTMVHWLTIVFYEVWADHADAIAKAYGGSGALKSDFTRTNKRTRKGALEDGYKSVMRYIKNNFFDGARQVCLLNEILLHHVNLPFHFRMALTWSVDLGFQERIHHRLSSSLPMPDP